MKVNDMNNDKVIKIGVIGATGYTGIELLRLLAAHPNAQVKVITSREHTGIRVDSLFPALRGFYDHHFVEPNSEHLYECDVVFFATPPGVAQEAIPNILNKGIKVIDLSADFRIRDAALWEKWYGKTHICPELLKQSVYGLPEINRQHIKNASLIACPGCYPTSVLLGFKPLLENGLVDTNNLIANVASGVSGAGREANLDNLLAETSDSYKAYSAEGHKHLPEIEQGLKDIAGSSVQLTFVPHLLPIIRGIHSTLYATLKVKGADLQKIYEECYKNESFIDVLPPGSHPQTRSVKGTNTCRISVFCPRDEDKVVVLVVEDNLVKGASGQAIQNMNILFGLPESTALDNPALLP
jgi:N-acetyl-gamma-glutamyl-phosphate reductase